MTAAEGAPPVSHAAANPLARPFADPLSEADEVRLAAAAAPPLAAAWRDAGGDFPYDSRAIEATRLALLSATPDPALLDAAAEAAVIFLYDLSHAAPAAVALARPALAALAAAGHPLSAVLLGKVVNAAGQLGDVDLHDRMLQQALARNDIEPGHRAQFLCLHADRLVRLGQLDAARRC